MGIVLLDYIILPNYVGYNNEHYLPDVRGDYLEKASYQLRALGFSIELIFLFIEMKSSSFIDKIN